MSKIETVCPYCKKTNPVQKSNSVDRYGLENIRCGHCSKSWQGNLSDVNQLVKSARPGGEVADLAVLRVQVRGQLDELVKRINGQGR